MSLETVFLEVLSVPKAQLSDSLSLKDIPSWDSMAHMMLIIRLEESFQMQFSGDEIADLITVGDIRSGLRRHGITL